MNTFRCLVIDDETLARELIENHLQHLPEFELVASCASAIEASQVLQSEAIDLMFLDIEMPVLKGTDFYQGLSQKPAVIFTTAYRDYALQGFELDAVDYLLKPIVFSRFFNAIEKFLKLQKTISKTVSNEVLVSHDAYIVLNKERKKIRLRLNDILYVKGMKDYAEIILENQTHIVKYTLTNLSQLLGEHFIRVHRSYIVNMERVTAFTQHDVEIDAHEIPVGKNHRKKLLQSLKRS
ncbi:Two-component transcriptional response regulator, LuxR family [hydrothermal vent metagenome]|uniref:Two-component transcriptional response regulator, LuxR family n=1 Tax=hydrothermal vent metagenome TaxID=652676 RepID=A0A3B0W0L2_9ZZZZ